MGFINLPKLVKLVSCALSGKSAWPRENKLGRFPYFETGLNPTQPQPIFYHGKLEDCVLEMFFYWFKTFPVYIYERIMAD